MTLEEARKMSDEYPYAVVNQFNNTPVCLCASRVEAENEAKRMRYYSFRLYRVVELKKGTLMKNLDIREYAKAHNVKLWQIANKLGINDGDFSRKLRCELPEETKQKIFKIIDEISGNTVQKE